VTCSPVGCYALSFRVYAGFFSIIPLLNFWPYHTCVFVRKLTVPQAKNMYLIVFQHCVFVVLVISILRLT